MSFHKRSISDYVNDIPMRFSNNFSQLIQVENHSMDLTPVYVDRLTSADFNYDFNVERIALQDAARERERVLKEAEEKLKELELNKLKLNETQIKKPVEDVINSSKPIQLTSIPTSIPTSLADYNLKNEYGDFNVKQEINSSQSNYGYSQHNYNYVTSSPTIYNSRNYNTSIAQESAGSVLKKQTQLPNTQPSSNLAMLNLTQPNQPNNITSNHQSNSTIAGNLSTTSLSDNIHSSLSQTNSSHNVASINLSTNNNYRSQSISSNSSTSVANNNLPSNDLINNSNRNLSINLQPNSINQQPINNQLTKVHHSDKSASIGNLQQPINRNNNQINIQHSNLLPNNLGQINQPQTNPNTMYTVKQPQLYSQSHHTMPINLPNYNPYPLATSNAYNPHAYLHSNTPISHLNEAIMSNHQINMNPTNQISNGPQNQSNTSFNYKIPNYVPSTSYASNAILTPQQSPLNTTNKPQEVNAQKVDNDKSIIKSNNTASTSNSINTTNNINSFIKPNGKPIVDVADFENSSSPFDDALLRSIDDKKELNNIFQQFYHNGSK